MKSSLFLITFCCIYVCSNEQSGSLDSAFGKYGKVRTDFHKSNDDAHAIAIQPDGKIVVGGFSDNEFGLVRYNTDGTLDTGFNKDGKVTTGFAGDNPGINAIAIQNDGKIVAAGSVYNYSVFDGNYYNDFALARYNTDGSLDTSFSNDGELSTDVYTVDDWATTVAIQTDGKIVVAGTSEIYYGYSWSFFVLLRYNPDGSLDKTFGGPLSGGLVTISLGDFATSESGSVIIQPDGKILLCGTTDNNLTLMRFNKDGLSDSTFGSDGIVETELTGMYGSVSAIALQADNKIVVAGSDYTKKSPMGFALWRYSVDGSLDSTFGKNGKLLVIMGSAQAYATSVALQSDNKIVASGYAYDKSFKQDFALIRCDTNGKLDSSFGINGKLMTGFDSLDNYSSAMQMNSNRIYVAGTVFKNTNDFAIVAYKNDASALPVTLTDFTADKMKSFIQLKWKIADEGNVDYYEIQRSSNTITFNTIGKKQATGSSKGSYTFTDFNPLQPINYYRLKIVDPDAKFTYSKIVAVHTETISRQIEVSPNPVTDFLNINLTTAGFNRVDIIDASGKIVKAMEFNVTNIPLRSSINLSSLPGGIYNIKITTDDKTSTSIRFLKL